GSQGSDFAEYTYFSLANYTSLGYGDLVPSGPLRFMAGMEALTGLVLIGWTAAFMYLEMRHIWERENSEPEVDDPR
ncbi:MAG TPA: potassium channel family protein, partial [Desulfobaccales bacterium]|nr:potassium channel family protein [Desulfobaccales bacterium]